MLLNSKDPIFDWAHRMQHELYFRYMPDPRQFSGLPYELDPAYQQNVPFGPWHWPHQQAHNDFNEVLPPNDFFDPTVLPIPTRIFQTNILGEANKDKQESWTWWTFVNHQEHYIADNSIQPLNRVAPP
jgi:hypothetical protein